MTDEQKKALITTITGVTDSALLSAYLAQAEDFVLRRLYPYGDYPDTFPTVHDRTQVDIAVVMIGKRGSEGQSYSSENGVTRTWEDGDIPPTLLRRIVPMAALV